MKFFKFTAVIFLSLIVTVGFSKVTFAFHSGGVAECVGCHSLHDGQSADLTVGTDPSSTCLSCHEQSSPGSYHISTPETQLGAGSPPINMTPGGDFGWLKKDYSWNPGWGLHSEDGDSHGHNIVAADNNYTADTTNITAPGGAFPSGSLACTSCHDNHSPLRRDDTGAIVKSAPNTKVAPIIASGSYNNSPIPAPGESVGVYRLLRGNGEIEGGVQFLTSGQIFNAVAPSSYNRAESATDTRVAYGKNVSEFCSACHPDMHEPISTKLTHPTSEALGTDELLNYNTYVGSGDMTGSAGSSFDSLVPYQEDNSTDYSAAGTSLRSHANSDGSFTSGPNAGDRVMCLSCHRAHASGWEHATRWDNDVEMIIVDGQWPGTDAASAPANEVKWSKGRVQAERARAYNDKPATNYATYQRSLCNKCHAKD